MNRPAVSTVLALASVFASLQDACLLGADSVSRSSLSSTPESVAELTKLETRVRSTIRSVLPAIVAVDRPTHEKNGKQGLSDRFHFENFGSGVIIRSDGLILSQWHVSHQAGLAVWRDPGDEANVVLQDGRRLKAELLGADPVRDLSLLRIVEPGVYPHLDLARIKQCCAGRESPETRPSLGISCKSRRGRSTGTRSLSWGVNRNRSRLFDVRW